MVVDPKEINRNTISDYLAFAGTKVENAHHGQEALKYLRRSTKTQERIDLILANPKLPDMDIARFAKEAEALEGAKEIPILLVSPLVPADHSAGELARSGMRAFADAHQA